jgi:hypothetical protein
MTAVEAAQKQPNSITTLYIHQPALRHQQPGHPPPHEFAVNLVGRRRCVTISPAFYERNLLFLAATLTH